MKYALRASRILLGLIFVVFGLNGIFEFFATPPGPEPASDFIFSLMSTGYLWWAIKFVEILAGILLLLNLFIPLALLFLAPIALNIMLFHIFLDPGGLPIAVIIWGLAIYLAWHYRASYKPLFVPSPPKK